MATHVIMPQGGQDLTEGTVLSWAKNEGDAVVKGELLCEVETEKATFEVDAPCDGVLLKILTPAGEVAEVFAPIGIVGEPGETPEPVRASAPNAAQLQEEPKIDIAAIRKRLGKTPELRATRIKASGRAKRAAREHDVDLAQVTGTGPGGRIVEQDVLNVLKSPETVTTAPPSASAPAAAAALEGRTEALSKMRQTIARRLQQSKQTIPHFYVTVSVEMTDALKLRQKLNAQVAADSPAKISLNDMIVKAAALALEEHARVNVILQEDAVVYLDRVNVGIAVSLEDGLIVPALPDVDILSLKGIAKKTKQLVAQAKVGKQAEFAQAAFTISNMGMLDVENFAAIINPPESAILAVGSAHKGVMVSDNNDLSIRDVMKMTISADHRVIDGALAATFINTIKYHLQHPKTLLT